MLMNDALCDDFDFIEDDFNDYGFFNYNCDYNDNEDKKYEEEVNADILEIVKGYLENTLEDEYGKHTLKECLDEFIKIVINEESKEETIKPFTMFYGYILCLAEISYVTEHYKDCINSYCSTQYLVNNLFDSTCISDKLIKYVYKARLKFITYSNLPDMLDNYNQEFNINLLTYKSIQAMLNILFAYNITIKHEKIPQEIRDSFRDMLINNKIELENYITLLKVYISREIYVASTGINAFEYMLRYNNVPSDKLHKMYNSKIINSLPTSDSFSQQVKTNCTCRKCNTSNYINCINNYNNLAYKVTKLNSEIDYLKSSISDRDKIISSYSKKISRLADGVYYEDTLFEIRGEDIPELMYILHKDHRDVLSRISMIVNSGKNKNTVYFRDGKLVDKTKRLREYRPVIARFKDKELYFESLASCALHFNTTEATLKKYVNVKDKLYLKSCLIVDADVPRDRFSREYDYQPLSRVKDNNDIKKLIEKNSASRKTTATTLSSNLEKARSAPRSNTPKYDGPVVALDEENSREFWFKSVRKASKSLNMTESKARSYIKSGEKTSGNYTIRESDIEEEHNYNYDRQLDVFVRYLGNGNRYLGKCFRGDK